MRPIESRVELLSAAVYQELHSLFLQQTVTKYQVVLVTHLQLETLFMVYIMDTLAPSQYSCLELFLL